MAPPTPVPTKCLTEYPNNSFTWATASSSHIGEDTAPTATWELGDNKDKGHAPCIVTKDSPEVTPTMCSTKCSGPTIEPDLTVAVVVTSATTAAASMELVAAGNAIGATDINNLDHPKVPMKCSMKCTESDNKPLMEHPKRNPWPPAWSGWKKSYMTWTTINHHGMRFYFVPPWPPPSLVSLTSLASKESNLVISDPESLSVWLSSVDLWGCCSTTTQL
uniref:Uncharacterized protein n=1 Tax=Oryza glaberrima TaxID=4538 RepID=I1Q5Y0_ORYGL